MRTPASLRLAALVGAILLAGCGGGGGGADVAAAPDQAAPVPDAQADARISVPAAASATAQAMVAFLRDLTGRLRDDDEPMSLDGFDPPRSDTTEPDPMD